MKWDGYKVNGYDKHPVKEPLKGAAQEKSSEEDQKKLKRRFRIGQTKSRIIDESASDLRKLARKLMEWRKSSGSDSE